MMPGFRPLIPVALALAASACNPEKPVSLDQARQITAEFQDQGIAPPPRTISDITAVLDQQKPDPARAERNRKAADAEPPRNASDEDLARFYFTRGIAAGELGRTEQRVRDLREAARLGRSAGLNVSRTLQDLAVAESEMGNGIATVRAIQAWQAEMLANVTGEPIQGYTSLAVAYARLGDFENAARAADTAQ